MSYHEVQESKITNGKAIASLVLGIVSIITTILSIIGLILGVIGLILGIIGLTEINHFKQEGRKVAVAGIICSSVGILLPILFIISAYMAFMNPTTY
ncbi:DUF4190 domain-containing protein [Dethiobacter alkaliphilus]|uniref:DUF4190 domain-containing protein n=1 Tax=Dethiobacter alkaliphilus TaxID=427926 RepID=UPI0022262463|nr:DUF4190 domain-containing protein [Dethiobacter alkaliphilus]MCW3491693.1 DUF4190 domain-containing protein [Dethiobacter alkaliphilus]